MFISHLNASERWNEKRKLNIRAMFGTENCLMEIDICDNKRHKVLQILLPHESNTSLCYCA